MVHSVFPIPFSDPTIREIHAMLDEVLGWRQGVVVFLLIASMWFIAPLAYQQGPIIFEVCFACSFVTLLAVSYWWLRRVVARVTLRPGEEFMVKMQTLATAIYSSVKSASSSHRMSLQSSHGSQSVFIEDLSGRTELFANEYLMMEKIIKKLTAFIAIHEDKKILHNAADEAVIDSLNHGQLTARARPALVSLYEAPTVEKALNLSEENAGLLSAINSWEFDALGLSAHDSALFLRFVFFESNQAVYSHRIDVGVFERFVTCIRLQYKEKPYHRFEHALDVCHTVFRYLDLTRADQFLRSTDRFALLVSALMHDVGHPGFNNQFLIQTSHELATRFNDRSPLENFHCALFFDLMRDPAVNILGHLNSEERQEVRKVIIDAVLHTDNFYHFAMVKEVSVFAEMHKDEDRFTAFDSFKTPEARTLMNKLFLHSADISNPTKPFHLYREWAVLVMEEFFAQGDRELELSITIQPLNDRSKVSIPQSQLGFMEFVVAPLEAQKFKLFPGVFSDNCQFLLANMVQWASECVATSPEEEAKCLERCNKVAGALSSVPGMCGFYVPGTLRRA